MKLKAVLIFLSSILLLSAVDPRNPLKGKLKSIYINQWGDTLSYHYDNTGRLSSLTTNRGFKTSYEYTGKTIVARTAGGSVVTMFLNSSGLVDSLVDIDTNRTTIYDPQGNQVQTNFGARRYFPYSGNHVLPLDEIAGATTHGLTRFSKKFIYDAAGNIKSEKIYFGINGKIHSENVMKNGNLVSYSVKYPIDTISILNPQTMKVDTKIVRQDDFTVKNTFDPGSTNTLVTGGLFGKSSKNLVLRSVHYSSLSADSTVTTFKYTFDAQKRVETLITKVKTNDPPEVKEFTERPDTCYFTYY